jgi:hypothetical protein
MVALIAAVVLLGSIALWRSRTLRAPFSHEDPPAMARAPEPSALLHATTALPSVTLWQLAAAARAHDDSALAALAFELRAYAQLDGTLPLELRDVVAQLLDERRS